MERSSRPARKYEEHIDKVEAAHKTGRARMWLTFDDIKTPDRWIPMVAMVTDVPGVHSIRVDYNREGEIEKPTPASATTRCKRQPPERSWAQPRASPQRDTKDAAMGAATAAAAAYMVESGLWPGVDARRKTQKIEVTLERSIYFGRAGSPELRTQGGLFSTLPRRWPVAPDACRSCRHGAFPLFLQMRTSKITLAALILGVWAACAGAGV